MVPLRVTVQGFLSYRDRQTLDFTGRNLWMLSGRNGVGKSTIFDAITFALFGDGRLGAKAVQDYWNHDARKNGNDGLVEFDFELSGKQFRAKRTFGRGSTFAIIPLDAEKIRPIPGTENKAGMKTWVDQNLPLGKETFELVALLKQGKADAFLDVDAKVRRSFMDKIVDIEPYSRFAEEVNRKSLDISKDYKRLQKTAEDSSSSIREIAKSLIGNLGLASEQYPLDHRLEATVPLLLEHLKMIEEASVTEIGAQADILLTLAGYAAHIKSWQESEADLSAWHQKAGEYQSVLNRAKELDDKKNRYIYLRLCYPQLKQWSEDKSRLDSAHAKGNHATSLREGLANELAELESERKSVRVQQDDADRTYQEATKK